MHRTAVLLLLLFGFQQIIYAQEQVRSLTAPLSAELATALDPVRLGKASPADFVATLPWALLVLQEGRRVSASPESLLRNCLRELGYPAAQSALINETFLKAYALCNNGGVFSSPALLGQLRSGGPLTPTAGPHAGKRLVFDYVIPPDREPVQARNPANLELRPESDSHRPGLDPRRRLWADRLAALLPPDVAPKETAEGPTVPSLSEGLQGVGNTRKTVSAGVFHRVNVRLNTPFPLVEFGARDLAFTLRAAGPSTVSFSISDYSRVRTVTRMDEYGRMVNVNVPASDDYKIEKQGGVDIRGNLAKAYFLFEVPDLLRIYFYDALDYSDNERPILIEPLILPE